MDELLEQFLIEGRDLVEQAQVGLARLEIDAGDAAAIDSVFRAIHTLKGSVGLFDMAPAERLLHAAEDSLERARKTGERLAPQIVAALVECLDQTDRWIDQLEHGGRLADTAELESATLLERFQGDGSGLGADGSIEAPPDWLAAFLKREANAIGGTATARTGFRYAPAPDCFFRGDDPLAIAGAVPELLALSVTPAAEAWPAMASIEPFTCLSVIEGLSAASIELVRGAFRMVSDQVVVAAIDTAGVMTGASEGANPLANVLRVDATRIDALSDGLGELIVATNALSSIAQSADRIDRELAIRLRAAQAQIDRNIAGLHRAVFAIRMVSLAPSLRRLPRMVREIAAQLGKPIRFELSGEGIEVDKQIADGLFEPLLHLIRNALDHGIESADHRVAAGKAANGLLTLGISREGDAILVSLSDDGAGIDPDHIRRIAIARGLVARGAAETLTDAAAIRLIFEPGFSTAETVTGVSGRGVGMDAVQVAVERLRGSIEIASSLGKGSAFTLRLPANAITTRLLVIEVGGDRYGVALDQIVETVRVESDALIPLGSGTAVVLRDRTVPVLSLATLLGADDHPTTSAKLLVTRSAGQPVALRVDAFAERIDTLVRPPSAILATVAGVTGTTLTGEGDVLLVLDLPELVA
jgi:two-component system chemotaxis sensor kinase CheA